MNGDPVPLAEDQCPLVGDIIYCQCGNPSSHYGTMGARGAREVKNEPPPRTAEHQDIDPFGVHSDEYNTWWRAARRKGWKLPVNNAFPDHSWIAYWQAMDRYEHGESKGRPVPPHRSA